MANLKTFLSSLALATTLAIVPGCDEEKKTDEKAADGDAAEGEAKDGEKKDDAKKADAKPLEEGAVFGFMPAKCEEARVYANMKGLATGAEGTMEEAEEKLMASLGGSDADKAEKVMKVLEDGGFKPKMIHEIAMCIGKDAPIVAIAHDPGLKDPLELIAKAVEAGGKPAPKVEEKDGVKFITKAEGKDGYIAAPQAGILLIGKDAAAVAPVLKGGDGKEAFSAAKGKLIWAAGDPPSPNKPSIDFQVADGDKSFDIALTMGMKGQQAEAMKKDPEKFKAEFEKQRDAFAGQLEKGPFKELAAPLKAVTFTVDGDKLVAKGALEKSTLESVTKTVGAMKPEELMKAF